MYSLVAICIHYVIMASWPKNHQEKVLKLTRKLGVLRPRDLKSSGVPRTYLKQLVERGDLLKTGRGLYVQTDAPMTENHSLAEAAKRSPKGVICLVSALRFHGLTTENPAEVWIAIPRGTRPPKSTTPTLRVVTLSGEMMTEGSNGMSFKACPCPSMASQKPWPIVSVFATASASTSRSRRCVMRGGTKRPRPRNSGITPRSAGCSMSCAPISTASHEKPRRFSPCPPGTTPGKTGEDYNVLLVRFTLERLLYRLSRSSIGNNSF
jgi:hypothetical protein